MKKANKQNKDENLTSKCKVQILFSKDENLGIKDHVIRYLSEAYVNRLKKTQNG